MARSWLVSGLNGLTAGVAANAIALWGFSQALRLGYCAPCLMSLPEKVGGEMNAALLQMIAAGLLGFIVGLLYRGAARYRLSDYRPLRKGAPESSLKSAR